jgi:HK97 family phage prohead protease
LSGLPTDLAPAVERRAAAVEVRTSGRRLVGTAATFWNVASIGARAKEQIAEGAFAASLADGRDILALVDHDPAKVIGRTRSGTLRLLQKSHGLEFEIDLPDTSAANDVLALATRGDLGGMSFGFIVPPGGETWQGELRTLHKIDLREISVVSAWPAYEGTQVSLRAAAGLGEREARRRRLAIAEASIWAR